MSKISNLFFLLRKPKVIIVIGNGRQTTKEIIFQVLKPYFKIGKEILIFETDLKNSKDFKKTEFLIKKSSLPLLVVMSNREQIPEIQKLIRVLPARGYLVLNFDDETVKELKKESQAPSLSFGFLERADLRASDIKFNNGEVGGTNFKINYQGNIVPVWLEKSIDKEKIYSILATIGTGVILDLNLVEISQALKKLSIESS